VELKGDDHSLVNYVGRDSDGGSRERQAGRWHNMASPWRDVLGVTGKACMWTQKDKRAHPRPAMARMAQHHKWQGDDEHGHMHATVVASNRASSGVEVQREART